MQSDDLRPANTGPEVGAGDPFAALMMDAPDFYGRGADTINTTTISVPGDLYPTDEAEYGRLLAWAQDAFRAGESAKSEHVRRWQEYYKLYRCFVEKKPGQWRSAVFIPITFWIIETITPRLVAQLPKFTAQPFTSDDVEQARAMEIALDWATDQSGLYVELVKAFKSSLKYGTGILKIFHRQDIRKTRKTVEVTAPITERIDTPVLDPDSADGYAYDWDGNQITETREVQLGHLPVGKQTRPVQYIAYDGPAAECIDIFNFGVAPEAHDVQSARYCYHRTYKDMGEVLQRVKEGVYHLPYNMTIDDITNVDDDPALKRQSSIGLSGMAHDATRRPVEVIEFWTKDGRVITMLNRKCIVRVQENPFDHSEKPFVRIVDHMQEHEFWGVGEIEPLEGLQTARNAITNSRIDNVRLLLNSMFYVNVNHVENLEDFEMRPGGLIRGTGDYHPDEVFKRIDLGDVTSSAYTEADYLDLTTEKVSGVSSIQMGIDSPSYNNTATGVAIQQELGASRFGLKSKLIEIEGLSALGRQFASILQQFMTTERQIRLGLVDRQTGEPAFETLTPESIQGAFDIGIESESMAQSDTVKQERRMNVLGLIGQHWPTGTKAAIEDVLESVGIRDTGRYLSEDMAGLPPHLRPQMTAPAGPPTSPGVEGEPPPAGGEVPPDMPGGFPGEGTPGAESANRMLQEFAAAYAGNGQV